jgi:hypothetical protein
MVLEPFFWFLGQFCQVMKHVSSPFPFLLDSVLMSFRKTEDFPNIPVKTHPYVRP